MPVISTRGQSGISPRVGGANVQDVGASAVAEAMSKVGAQGAALANSLLLERKVSQANRFAQEWASDKSIQSEQQRTDFASRMYTEEGVDENGSAVTGGEVWSLNPEGKKITTGRTVVEHMREWDSNYSKSVLDKAPTNLAAERFSGRDAGISQRNNILAEKYQFDTLREVEVRNTSVKSEQGAKLTRAHDEDAPGAISRRQYGFDRMDDAQRRLLMVNEKGFIDQNTLAKLGRQQLNPIAQSIVDGHFTDEKLGKAANDIGADRLLKDNVNKELFKKEMQGFVSTLRDGSVIQDANYNSETNKFVIKAKNKKGVTETFEIDGDGKGVEITRPPAEGEVIAPVRSKIDAPSIDIEGKLSENRVLKNLTPPQQQGYFRQLISSLKQKLKKSNKRLRIESDSLKEANSRGEMLPDFTNADDKNTMAFRNIIDRIQRSFDEDTADDMIVKQYAATLAGRVGNSITLDSAADSETQIRQVNNELDTILQSEGFDELAKDEIFTKKVKLQVQDQLNNQLISKLNNHHKAEWVLANSSTLQKKFSKIDSPEGHQEYLNELATSQDKMAIPAFARTTYPKDYLLQQTEDLDTFLNPARGEAGKLDAANWIQRHMETKGEHFDNFMEDLVTNTPMERALVAASSLGSSPKAIRARTEILDSFQNEATLNPLYSAATKERELPNDSDLNSAAYAQLEDSIDDVLIKTNTSDKTKQSASMLKAMTLQMKKIALRTGEKDAKALSDVAWDQLFKDTVFVAKSGSSKLVVGRGTMERAGVTEQQITAGVEVMSNPEKWLGQVDVMKTFSPSVISDLKRQGLTDKQIKTNLETRWKKTPVELSMKGNEITPLIVNPNTGKSGFIMDKNNNPIQIPLRSLKDDKDVNAKMKDPIFNFFGAGAIQNFLDQPVKE